MFDQSTPDLNSYDVILLNSSAGKDSQAMLDRVFWDCVNGGVDLAKVVVVHSDLGRAEWKGTKELAERQAAAYSLRFLVTTYTGKYGDLLGYIKARGKFPDSKNRYCTSDLKRGPVRKVITQLADEVRERTGQKHVRVLNCLGLRADESPARAKKVAFERDEAASNGRRTVDTWLPIHHWNVAKVWETINNSGVPYHHAYDLGMPRLSCCFCVFAPKDALVIAGRANPELLQEYVDTEAAIGHTFRHKFSIKEVQDAITAGYQPSAVQSWNM